MADADAFDDVGLGPAGTEPAMSPTQDTTDMEVSGLAPEQIVTCDFIDPQAHSYIADLLLTYAAEGCDPKGKKAVGAVSSFVQEVRGLVVPSLDPSNQNEGGFGAQLKTALGAMCIKRKTTWRKVFTGDPSKREAQVTAARAELDKPGGLFDLAERRGVAKDLIDRCDTHATARCGRAFASAEALTKHQLASCVCRGITCRHHGCSVMCAARHVVLHEHRCGRRPVQCGHNGGCGAMVAYEDAAVHVAQLCPRRSVPCPFAAVGCTPRGGLLAEALVEHCHGPPPMMWMRALAAATAVPPTYQSEESSAEKEEAPWTKPLPEGRQGVNLVPLSSRSDPEAELDISEGVHHHLLLAVRTITAQGNQIEELRRELADSRTASERNRVALATLQAEFIGQVGVAMTAREKETKAVEKKCDANRVAAAKKVAHAESRVLALETHLKKVARDVEVLHFSK